MAVKSRKTDNDRVDTEVGTIRKSWNDRIRIALAYPNQYHVGMSNLGYQTVYRIFNRFEHVVCERVFVEEKTARTIRDPRSVESNRRLVDFDVIAFSISFENDYNNLLTILDQAGLPLRANERSPHPPLVIAGGVACQLNPEPLAPFIDCFLIGEAESLIPEFLDAFDPLLDTPSLLKTLSRRVTGIYIPAFYEASYDNTGALSDFSAVAEAPERIPRSIQTESNPDPAFSCLTTPHTTFDDTYLIEVSRGCPHGCRFCAAGFIYRPPRFHPLSALTPFMEEGCRKTRKIGLVGAAVSDHPDLEALCRSVRGKNIRLSFSSLRADALTPGLLATLGQSGVKTATIAPDAGSERMRRVINKGLTEEAILDASDKLVSYGIPNLRLYFMVGLPTETDEDIDAIVRLCKAIKHRFLQSSRSRKRMGSITVSLSSFVPKPFTPFQWAAMDEIGAIKKKIKKIKSMLNPIANIRVHADVPRWAYIQALLSRGDRRVGEMLLQVHQNQGNWAKTLKESSLNADYYVHRERPMDEYLPWDFIDHGIRKAFLKREYRRALTAEPTAQCVTETCTTCGVCGDKAD